MTYSLNWRSPALPYTQKQNPISVNAGATVSNAASLRFTGKGAANYGKVLQENLMRLLECFAGPTAPDYPTVGQHWYDTSIPVMKICVSTAPEPVVWEAQYALQITDVGNDPVAGGIGSIWFQRTGSASGILYVYDGVGRYGPTGGWSQVWPQTDIIGGREEYDLIRGLVNSMIGLTADGGNGANGRLIDNVSDLTALDTAMQNAWTALGANDGNVVSGNAVVGDLKASPNSQDWDTLLAAAKYAISRLELPTTMVDDISPVPFAADGRPAAPSLLALSTTDVRYPTNDRLVNRRYGIISLNRFYQETYNVIQAGITNRWMLKGMLGASGTNTSFGATTTTTTQGSFTASAAGSPFATAVTHGLIYRFSTVDDMQRFFTAAQALEIMLTHTPGGSPTSADVALKALTDTAGRIRVINNMTLTMTPALSPALFQAPGANGFLQFSAGPVGVTLSSVSGAGASIVVRGITESATSLRIEVDITAGGATTGTFAVDWKHINDTITYTSGRVYPIPLTYTGTDKVGSVLFT